MIRASDEAPISLDALPDLLTVDDVADCVAWIASDGAGFLTGQTIVLDGGLTILSPLTRLEEPR